MKHVLAAILASLAVLLLATAAVLDTRDRDPMPLASAMLTTAAVPTTAPGDTLRYRITWGAAAGASSYEVTVRDTLTRAVVFETEVATTRAVVSVPAPAIGGAPIVYAASVVAVRRSRGAVVHWTVRPAVPPITVDSHEVRLLEAYADTGRCSRPLVAGTFGHITPDTVASETDTTIYQTAFLVRALPGLPNLAYCVGEQLRVVLDGDRIDPTAPRTPDDSITTEVYPAGSRLPTTVYADSP